MMNDKRTVEMEAVLSLLDAWDIHSTIEWPGYLHVEWPDYKDVYWAVSPNQDDLDREEYCWTGELYHEGKMISCLSVSDVTLRGLTRRLYVEMWMKVEQGVKLARKLVIESADGLRCEMNHGLVKVFEPGQKFVHRLLCPRCDNDIIREMEKEANEAKGSDSLGSK